MTKKAGAECIASAFAAAENPEAAVDRWRIAGGIARGEDS
jgi:hypothetical protein